MHSIFKNKEKRKGMTLIELLVVIAMISIITGVTWANFRQFGRSFDIERDIGRMAQEVRASLEMTMARRHFVIPADCPTSTSVLVAYGVHFQRGVGSYNRMVYVINNDRASAGFGSFVCPPIVIETVRLDQGSISLIRVFSGTASSDLNELNIIFTPPHPRTYIGSIVVHPTTRRWSSERDAAEISTSLGGVGDTVTARTLRVNRVGLIEIQPRP